MCMPKLTQHCMRTKTLHVHTPPRNRRNNPETLTLADLEVNQGPEEKGIPTRRISSVPMHIVTVAIQKKTLYQNMKYDPKNTKSVP